MRTIVVRPLLALLSCFWAAPTVNSTHARQTVTRELSGGESHTTSLTLAAGQAIVLRVEQAGVDVIVVLRAPDGSVAAEVNRPIGAHGPEFLCGVAEASGAYVIEVRAANRQAQRGRYELTMAEPRLKQASDALCTAAQTAVNKARALRDSGIKSGLEKAVAVFVEAVQDYQTAGDLIGAADALIEQGRTTHFLGDVKTAGACFEQARALYVQAGEPHGEALAVFRYGGMLPQNWQPYFRQTLERARTLGNHFLAAKALREIGYDAGLAGKPDEGIGLVREALASYQHLGYRYDEAEARLSLSWMLNDLGRLQEGTEETLQAARLHREDGNRRELANALLHVSDGWLLLGDAERARDAVAEALAIARTGGHRLVEILALLKYSDVHLRLGQPRDALSLLEAALPLSEQANNYQLPRVLKALGQVRLALRQTPQALEALQKAYALYQQANAVSGRADVNFYLAQSYEQLGELDRAQTEYARTLADFQQRDERLGVARTLLSLARVQARQNQLDAAAARNTAALTLLESLRQGLAKYATRTTFFATMAEAYAQQIDLLMARPPSREQRQAAFAVSERARARALLEMVNETRLPAADNALLDALRQAQQQLNEAALQRLAANPGTSAADARLRALAAEVETARTRLRTAQPRYADLTQPTTLDAATVQALLDPDTLLLEYALGTERSYVWALSRDDIASYALPNRAVLDAAARALHQALKTNQPSQAQAAALSRLVVRPVAAQLGKRRLLIVADGALQYIPFAVLPHPQATSGQARPLLESHEIAHLPSASVLAVLRREAAARQRAPQTVAVFADPVFSRQDARVLAGTSAPLAAPAETTRGGALARVTSAQAEAAEIAKLAPPGTALIAQAFAANREAVLHTDLTPYRVIHFATHGWVDSTHPDLSWLALSLVDEHGGARDGYLRLHEIYDLRLNAELVVLSACETALGQEVKGEGLLGLTRGFMYAGTPRVVASLWQVNSTATANLMKAFYRGLLRDGLPPAAALRVAQLEMRQRGLSPYYWGAFVLQGEWR